MEGRLSTHVLNGETEEEKHRKTPSVYVSLSLSDAYLCPSVRGFLERHALRVPDGWPVTRRPSD